MVGELAEVQSVAAKAQAKMVRMLAVQLTTAPEQSRKNGLC